MAASPTLSGLTLWNSNANKVKNSFYDFDTGQIALPVPLLSSSSTFTANVLGKKQEIVLDGEYFGTTAEIGSFIAEMLGWFNISQLVAGFVSTRTLTNRFGLAYVVKPKKFAYTDNFEAAGKIDYQLELIEALT